MDEFEWRIWKTLARFHWLDRRCNSMRFLIGSRAHWLASLRSPLFYLHKGAKLINGICKNKPKLNMITIKSRVAWSKGNLHANSIRVIEIWNSTSLFHMKSQLGRMGCACDPKAIEKHAESAHRDSRTDCELRSRQRAHFPSIRVHTLN